MRSVDKSRELEAVSCGRELKPGVGSQLPWSRAEAKS